MVAATVGFRTKVSLLGSSRRRVVVFVAFSVLGIALLLAPGSALGATSYTASTLTPTGVGPRSVAVGDLNGDGKPDIATANFDDSTVSVFLRNSAGTGWDAATTISLTGVGPTSVAIGDLNGDGKPDLATANLTSATVSVITRSADNSGWDAPTSAGATGAGPRSVAIGDLNGDGKPDLATADSVGNEATVITRKADNSGWDAPVLPVATTGNTSSPRAVVIADVNGDGRPDVVLANFGNGAVVYVPRKPDNSGWNPLRPLGSTGAGTGPTSLAIGDLNADGYPDLATANATSGTVTAFTYNPSAVQWTAASAGATGGGPTSVAVGDLNGDHYGDIATADTAGGGSIGAFTRTAAGTGWDHSVAGSTGAGPQAVAIGDVNGDGLPDLVTANQLDSSVTVLTEDDTAAPVTTDDVHASYYASAAPVTLAARDSPGSGVAATYYTIGTSPPAPTSLSAVYDPLAKPTLADGQSIRYFSVDRAGNAESVKASLAAHVSPPATTSYGASTVGVPTTGDRSTALGDLNGDGLADLATAEGPNSRVTVTLRKADNSGWDASTVAGATGGSPFLVAIGDVNGDGRPDLVTADSVGNTVTVITRKADNSGWDAPVSLPGVTGSSAVRLEGVAIGDVNGDGRPDIAAADNYYGAVTVFTRKADNSGWNAAVRASAPIAATSGTISVAIADVNGDGLGDLVTGISHIVSGSATLVVTARNATNTGWDPPVAAAATGASARWAAIGDVNGDGRPDLVGADVANSSVIVVTRNAAGTGWDAPASVASGGTGTIAVAISDVNGDGRSDLVMANDGSSDVTLLTRNADNTGWDTPTTLGVTGADPVSLSAGDVNGDGRPDFATSNFNAASVTVLTAVGDTVPPTTSDDVDAAWHASPVPVTLTATDTGGSGVAATYYTTGVTPATPTTSSLVYDAGAKPTLDDGERISYFSVDAAGNAEAVNTSSAAIVDGAQPDTVITGAPASSGSDTQPQVSFTSPALAATFECSLDGSVFAACASPFQPADALADGDHTVAVRAVSRAGLSDSSPASVSFVIDTSAPQAPIALGGPPASGAATTVSIAFTQDPGSSATCQLDDAVPVACSSPYTVTGLSVGPHVVRVVQTDAAGQASDPLVVSFTVTPPDVTPQPSSEPTKIALSLGRPLLGNGRTPLVLHDGSASLGCGATAGVVVGCDAQAVSLTSLKTRSGRLPAGTVLATGSSANGVAASSSLGVTMKLTARGRLASALHPLGVSVRLTLTARSASGQRYTVAARLRLVENGSLVILVPGHATALPVASRRMLARLVRVLPVAKAVRCVADTDAAGSAAHDVALTRKQAEVACAYLRSRGLMAKLTRVGHGHARPRASNRSKTGRALNRRLTIVTTL